MFICLFLPRTSNPSSKSWEIWMRNAGSSPPSNPTKLLPWCGFADLTRRRNVETRRTLQTPPHSARSWSGSPSCVSFFSNWLDSFLCLSSYCSILQVVSSSLHHFILGVKKPEQYYFSLLFQPLPVESFDSVHLSSKNNVWVITKSMNQSEASRSPITARVTHSPPVVTRWRARWCFPA